MTLDKVKQYLRVDWSDEDDLIQGLMDTAREYIVSAVGAFDDTDPAARLLLLVMVQDMYDNRELMQSDIQQKKSFLYTYRSMILQLKLKYELKKEA